MAPLSVLGLHDWVVQVAKGGAKVEEKLRFNVQTHPDAQSKVAQDMHERLVRDMKVPKLEYSSIVPNWKPTGNLMLRFKGFVRV
jgi:hypothetical protein